MPNEISERHITRQELHYHNYRTNGDLEDTGMKKPGGFKKSPPESRDIWCSEELKSLRAT